MYSRFEWQNTRTPSNSQGMRPPQLACPGGSHPFNACTYCANGWNGAQNVCSPTLKHTRHAQCDWLASIAAASGQIMEVLAIFGAKRVAKQPSTTCSTVKEQEWPATPVETPNRRRTAAYSSGSDSDEVCVKRNGKFQYRGNCWRCIYCDSLLVRVV